MSENPAIKQFQLAGVVYDLQVDSVNNCNPTAANQNKFDWIGTQAEYVAQDVATNHPDWVCFITDDISDQTGIIDLSNYVKRTGDAEISGTKTFVTTNTSSNYPIKLKHPKTLASGESTNSYITFHDASNIKTGHIENILNDGNTGKSTIKIRAQTKNTSNQDVISEIQIIAKQDGTVFATAPTPTSLVNNNTITTAAYITTILSTLYPVGSLYLGTQSTCPLITLIPGSTWELVAQDRSLQGSSTNHAANTTIAAGLPDHTHAIKIRKNDSTGHHANGNVIPHIYTDGYTYQGDTSAAKNASESNPIYGASTTVQPPAYVTNVWRRTA